MVFFQNSWFHFFPGPIILNPGLIVPVLIEPERGGPNSELGSRAGIMPVYLAFVPHQTCVPGLGQCPSTWLSCRIKFGLQGWDDARLPGLRALAKLGSRAGTMPVYLAFVPYQIRAPGLGRCPSTWPSCLSKVGLQGWVVARLPGFRALSN